MGGRRGLGRARSPSRVVTAATRAVVRVRARRAQSAMEYLMITSLVLLAIVGILVIGFSQSATFSREVSQAQVQKIARQIADAADTVSYAGEPSKKTISVHFPDHIREVIIANNTLTFIAGGTAATPYEYLVIASTNMTGELRTFPGLHRITIQAGNGIVNITDG